MKKLLYLEEEFTEHPTYLGYFVSRSGKVVGTFGIPKTKRDEKGRLLCSFRSPYERVNLLKPANRGGGYLFVVIHHNHKRQNKFVHALVLETYQRGREKGEVCRHLNSNPQDNRVENLAWGSQKANMADKYIHGTQQTGEKHPSAVLTWPKVKLIRHLKELRWQYTKLQRFTASLWSLKKSTFDGVYYNHNWVT